MRRLDREVAYQGTPWGHLRSVQAELEALYFNPAAQPHHAAGPAGLLHKQQMPQWHPHAASTPGARLSRLHFADGRVALGQSGNTAGPGGPVSPSSRDVEYGVAVSRKAGGIEEWVPASTAAGAGMGPAYFSRGAPLLQPPHGGITNPMYDTISCDMAKELS
jgi:hypothetical protein